MTYTAAAEGIYQSMRDRDLSAFTALVHPDIEVRQPAWLPYGGQHRGLQSVLAMFREVLKLIDVRNLELVSLVAADHHVWAEFVVQSAADAHDLLVAEHWQFEHGLARRLDVWFQDPSRLMTQTAGDR